MPGLPDHKPDEVLDFWLGGVDDNNISNAQERLWWGKKDEDDRLIRQRFEPALIQGSVGNLRHWEETPRGRVALVILLDQFSRSIYRDTPKAFENDPRALSVCLRAIDDHADEDLKFIERVFLYMPLVHAEDIKIQKKSLEYFGKLAKNIHFRGYMDYPQRHYDIIAKFGRYPHRNEILGRISTAEEKAFLKQPGSSF